MQVTYNSSGRNIHAVSHFKHETFTALQYSQNFGTITKETLQKTTMAFESIKLMQPLPSAEISAETGTAMKEEDEYDTASDNDICDTEEEISPVAVSRPAWPTNTRPFSLGFVWYVLSRLAMG